MSAATLMARALELAAQGAATCSPNPQVGCVIARGEQVVGEGFHRYCGEEHAEARALAAAGEGARGAEVYVTLEPCAHQGSTPPCVEALIAAKVARVVIALEDPDARVAGRGLAKLREAGIACEVGLLADEARWQNRGYLARKERGRPWVRLKTATSMDGRVALADGSSRWITDRRSRAVVHELRTLSCALLTGSGTALADDPLLSVRAVPAERQPRRVLVDGAQRCDGGLRMLQEEGAIVAIAGKRRADYGPHAQVLELGREDAPAKVDLAGLLAHLAREEQLNLIQAECGGGLAGALIAEGLVDEVVAFVAPRYLGAGISVSDFAGVTELAAAPGFALRAVAKLDADAMLTLERER